MVSNEPVLALLSRLASHLDEVVAPERIPQGFVESALYGFLDERAHFGEDVFECVAAPTPGASVSVLRLRVSGAFERYATRAAKDFFGIRCH